jgi:hypothetical protein
LIKITPPEGAAGKPVAPFDWKRRPRETNEVTMSRKEEPAVGSVVEEFVGQIESLATSLPLAMLIIQAAHRAAHKSYDDFVEKNCEQKMEGEKSYIIVPFEHNDRYNVLKKRVQQTSTADSVVPRSFQVSLVSSYDAFLGKLVGALFRIKPELLKSSDRTLTYSQLSEFGSISEAREHLLEKEIETLLRKSHSDQFEWLENRFSVKLRVDLPVWPTFIEVTERRNLFVHSDGIVSSQYLKVCREHEVALDGETKQGSQLEVPHPYFKTAYEAIFEIGVKLGQVLWRKLKPSEIDAADANLTSLCYELLKEKRYRLAQKLLDFACSPAMKHADDKSRLIFLVNRAQAYKWDGESEKALSIVASQDWTATGAMFQLAEAVLRDNYTEAVRLMESIGSKGEPDKSAYKTWPLFRQIRKTKEFGETFEKIFGEPLGKVTPVDGEPDGPDGERSEDQRELPPTIN